MKLTLFYIPVRDDAEASALSKIVIENRLAACANIYPSQSFYPWEGQMQHDMESVLILKTIPAAAVKLQALIEKHHSYETPCIIHWETEVNDKYGLWVIKQVKI